MFNAPNDIFKHWNKPCFIASKLDPTEDIYGNEITQYDVPKKYIFNYQPVTDEAELAAYGITNKGVVRAILTNNYLGKIKEYDLAYLYGATPDNETKNGQNANYVVKTFIPQNSRILVYFERRVKK